jgi:hypothetical protein
MKTRLFLLFLAAALFGSPGVNAGAVEISANDAFTVVKNMFKGQDVDYYLRVETGTSAYWYIYVDAEPTKGWNHDCYFYQIAKRQDETTPIDSIVPRTKVKLQHPPKNSTFLPLSVKNRYGDNSKSKPVVKKVASANAINNNEVASRTYAVILSGGYNEYSNYERYWNDCSFLYQTLVNKYQIPKSNVYALMADGDDPEADMLSTSGVVVSQSLDLDFDGSNEISYSASKANVKSVLADLAGKLQEDDHLLFYVIDHGGSTDNASASYIWLWKYEQLFDYELAEMLAPFSANNVNVNVVLGQCFSGGFIDDLQSLNCVVSTACRGDEYSYACSTIPYDEFVYRWTSAINEANHTGTAITSDADSNGRVTMEEAFAYAKANDTRDETPQYLSTPLSIGEDLAMNRLAPAVDIYIKDNYADTGKEPNRTTDKFWKSPSIWVRNQADSIQEHENPVYSSDHLSAIIYVWVHNRGKAKFNDAMWLHLYWAEASTGLTDKAWKGREINSKNMVTGEHLRATTVPAIDPGDSVRLAITWALPYDYFNDTSDGTTCNHHFCLMARLTDMPYDDGYDGTAKYFRVDAFNDQTQKNVSVIYKNKISEGTDVYVRNVGDTEQNYSLEFVPHTTDDATLYNLAQINMELSAKIDTAWVRGGMHYAAANVSTNSVGKRVVRFTSADSKLENVNLAAGEFDVVTMRFAFRKVGISRLSSFTYDLIQRDADGNIVGGETFIIESPYEVNQAIEIKPDPLGGGATLLTIDQKDAANIRWEDSSGQEISDSSSVIVSPTVANNEYSVYLLTDEGGLASGSIALDVPKQAITATISGDFLNVNFSESTADDGQLQICSIADGSDVISLDVAAGTTSESINVSGLNSGIYTISYVAIGSVIDAIKFIK